MISAQLQLIKEYSLIFSHKFGILFISGPEKMELKWSQSLIIRIVIAVVSIVIFQSQPALSLVYQEMDELFIYYPESEERIATRLIEKFPSVRDFLEEQGLPLKLPLHVILDNKLDRPVVEVKIIPHREIRIPMRAPGVLEEGYLEADPWTYFFIKGLFLQGLYSEKSGIYSAAEKVFGQLMSPNKILPQWIKEGVCHLLFRIYTNDWREDPYYTALFESIELPDIDDVSHHPERWPGQYSYRIFGIPFIEWLYHRHGWGLILDFIRLHGRGLVPIEIDQKARETYGKSYSELWEIFRLESMDITQTEPGLPIIGYWPEPLVYWNFTGIYPGVVARRSRSRYGYVTKDAGVRVSEYSVRGRSRLYEYRNATPLVFGANHIWDPGPGNVAVGRRGSRPGLLLLPEQQSLWLEQFIRTQKTDAAFIASPEGLLGMSGPVKAEDGRIAVAANIGGNWDIWIYDGQWLRVTSAPSVEMDPWWEGDRLVFSSNISGCFQIHAADMRELTQCPTAGVLPRKKKFLCLQSKGWRIGEYESDNLPDIASVVHAPDAVGETPAPETQTDKPYTPFKSIWPNYIRPDGFISTTDFQIGLVTAGQDVSKRYRVDAGARYSFELDYLSVVAGGNAKELGLRFSRYPISYTPKNARTIDESRYETRISWQPAELRGLEAAANGRWYEPLAGPGNFEDKFWGSLTLARDIGRHWGWLNLDVFTGNSQSLFGGIDLLFGERIYTSIHLLGGKTWGDIVPGQNTFRIGGNLTEGYFTQRPTRLFPLRGFDDNILEAEEAFSTGVEVYWPLLNLQQGYKTLPFFLHRLRLGTFVDAGAASESLSVDDLLVGAGFELVTSMQIGWGRLSSFRVGLGWPVVQPDYLDESGPVLLIQLGKPL
jgi:hypothetical protein